MLSRSHKVYMPQPYLTKCLPYVCNGALWWKSLISRLMLFCGTWRRGQTFPDFRRRFSCSACHALAGSSTKLISSYQSSLFSRLQLLVKLLVRICPTSPGGNVCGSKQLDLFRSLEHFSLIRQSSTSLLLKRHTCSFPTTSPVEIGPVFAVGQP